MQSMACMHATSMHCAQRIHYNCNKNFASRRSLENLYEYTYGINSWQLTGQMIVLVTAECHMRKYDNVILVRLLSELELEGLDWLAS